MTIRDARGSNEARDARWGVAHATSWPEDDVENNLYVGLTTSSTFLHGSDFLAPADEVDLTWRVNTTAATQAGSYSGTIDVIAVARL